MKRAPGYYTRRLYIIIKYWFKLICSDERKNVNVIDHLMLNDLAEWPYIQNWAALAKNMLSILGFFHVYVAQGARDEKNFLSLLKQRVNDHFIQNWHQRLNESSRALLYRQIYIFQFQPYLEKVVHTHLEMLYPN